MQEAADRASLLASLVVTPDGRQVHVGVLLDNVPDFVFWIGGAALAGATVVGINSSRTASEVADDVAHADVDLVVTESRWRHLVGAADVPVLDVDDPAYADLLAPHRGAALPAAAPAPDDLAFLLFSSGSTGRPKAVVVSQGRIARLAEVLAERVRLTRASTTYLCMPLFHGNAVMMNLVPAMATGATIGLARRFSASGFSADVHRFGATYVNYVGRALSYVLASDADPRDATSTLELAYGTEASTADCARFAARFGCEVQEGYGLSEGVLRITPTPDSPPGSLGLPAGGLDVRILDEATGEECAPGVVGQIVAVGLAHTFEGYYDNPGAMAERVRGDDFWSGDLGYRDEAGFFWFAGRSSDWLRVDSENFAAAQVERVLQRHPDVAAAPVYAVPDPVTGDRVMAALEPRAGATLDVPAFGRWLADQPDLGAKWWPSFLRLVDAVPLTGSGKVDKAPLRRAAWLADDVWVRVGRTSEYAVLDAAGVARLAAELEQHGRTRLLG